MIVRLEPRVGAGIVIPLCVLTVYLSYSRAGAAGSALAVLATIAFGRNRWLTAVHALVGAGASALVILVVRNHHAIAEATGNAGETVRTSYLQRLRVRHRGFRRLCPLFLRAPMMTRVYGVEPVL